MNAVLMQNPEVNQQFLSKIPVGQWGKVEESGNLLFTFAAMRRPSLPGRIF